MNKSLAFSVLACLVLHLLVAHPHVSENNARIMLNAETHIRVYSSQHILQ